MAMVEELQNLLSRVLADSTIQLSLILMTIVIPAANAISQRLVFKPLGKWYFGIKDPKKTDMDQTAKLRKLQKFEESGWKFIAYGTISAVSAYALADKPFWRDTRQLWTDCSRIPCEYDTPPEMRLAYACDLAFYAYGIPFALLFETKRKDMAAMLTHHVLTVVLIGYSYALGLTKIGVVIMFIHDICDFPLELAKMARYADMETLTNVVFGGFTALWIYMRNYFYPFQLVRSVVWEAYDALVVRKGLDPWPHYHLFCAMLVILGVLQVYWTAIILKILYTAIFKGDGISDSRDPNDSDDD